MNNPLGLSGGGFKLRSLKNKEQDEKSLIYKRTKMRGNPCPFPKKIYVINREDRQDRWENFCKINSDLFLSFDVQRWSATTVNPTIGSVVDAIFDSFLSCLKKSFETEETIIIMEDDAYLADGGREKLLSCWKDLPGDWDVLIGNHYWFYEMEILTDHLAKPKGRASTANFIVARKTILPKILENLSHRGNPSTNDFDHFITCDEVPVNNYTVWPMISREISSYSDHKGKNLDSSMKIRENAYKYLFVDQEKYYPSIEGW